MNVPIAGPEGNVWVPEDKLTEKELSIVGSHQNAVEAFLSARDPKGKKLDDFKGKTIHGVLLVTDREQIRALADDDQLGFENFYEP